MNRVIRYPLENIWVNIVDQIVYNWGNSSKDKGFLVQSSQEKSWTSKVLNRVTRYPLENIWVKKKNNPSFDARGQGVKLCQIRNSLTSCEDKRIFCDLLTWKWGSIEVSPYKYSGIGAHNYSSFLRREAYAKSTTEQNRTVLAQGLIPGELH